VRIAPSVRDSSASEVFGTEARIGTESADAHRGSNVPPKARAT
jgi:hypothetical protein